MKYENILVPYDGSDSAKKALATALEYVDLGIAGKATAFFAAPVPQFETQDFKSTSAARSPSLPPKPPKCRSAICNSTVTGSKTTWASSSK